MGMIRERLHPTGLMTFSVFDGGELVEQRVKRNLICDAGLAQLAAAFVWAAAADQNDALGDPLSSQVLYPLYGAVGSGTTPAATSDTRLATELGRQTIAGAEYAASQVILSFFYPTTAVDWSVSEVGVFVSGGGTTASSSANTGLLFNHAVFSAVTKTAAQTATLQASFTF